MMRSLLVFNISAADVNNRLNPNPSRNQIYLIL
jgi:hypothetical protein